MTPVLVKDYTYVQRSVSYYGIMDSVRRDRFIKTHSCGTLSLAGVATSIICHDKRFVARKTCMSRQKYACPDKRFAMTNICRDKHNFDSTKVLLRRQAYFGSDKHVFAVTRVLSIETNKNDTCGSSRQ